MNKAFYFHIPKTCGLVTSRLIHNNMKNELGKDFLDKRASFHNLSGYIKNQPFLYQYDIYLGHVPYMFATRLIPEGTVWGTMLRDPIERAISHWNHMRGGTLGHYGYEVIHKFDYDIEDAMKHDTLGRLLSNFQTRYLGFTTFNKEEGPPEDILRRFEINHLFDPEEAFDTALMVIENDFDNVGFSDDFHSFVKWFLGINNVPFVISEENIMKPHTPNYPSHVIEMLEERNQYDIKLYEYAKEKFK